MVANKERTVWLKNTEPKFTRKKDTKLTKVAFDTKIKRYTHEGREIPVEEPIRLDIPDSYIYFSFHPTKNKYIMIDAPNNIMDEYSDIFSKDQYDISTSTHPPIEIPTEGPPCISAPYTIPLKFRPWADNTINKLLEAGMIQWTMSTWASPVIIVPKKGLELPKDIGTPLPVTAKLRLVCDYRKLNKMLPADLELWQRR